MYNKHTRIPDDDALNNKLNNQRDVYIGTKKIGMSKPGWCDMQAFASSTRIAHNGLLEKKQQLIEF